MITKASAIFAVGILAISLSSCAGQVEITEDNYMEYISQFEDEGYDIVLCGSYVVDSLGEALMEYSEEQRPTVVFMYCADKAVELGSADAFNLYFTQLSESSEN